MITLNTMYFYTRTDSLNGSSMIFKSDEEAIKGLTERYGSRLDSIFKEAPLGHPTLFVDVWTRPQ